MTGGSIMTDTRNPGLSRSAMIFFISCFLLVCFVMFLIFRPFLSILVWACVLTVVFQPLFRVVHRMTRNRRILAAFVTCLLILVLIIVPVTLLAILISQQSVELYHTIQNNSATLDDIAASIQDFENRHWVPWLVEEAGRLFGPDAMNVQKILQQALSGVSKFVVSNVPSLLAGVGDLIYRFFMIFITMFFLFCDGSKILQLLRDSNPLPAAYESEFIRNFENVSYATFYGTILGAIMQGTAAAMLYWILGIDSPLFWGAAVSFVSLVPILGSLLIWLPMPTYLYFSGHSTKAVILLILGGICLTLIENVVKPLIIGGRSDMHPLLIFFSVLGGLQVFGFLGILLGPLFVTIFLTFLGFFRHQFEPTVAEQKQTG